MPELRSEDEVNLMRDRLIELCREAQAKYLEEEPPVGDFGAYLADHLLANGVIVPPVRIGQRVWYIKGGYYNSAKKHPCEIEVTEINQKFCGKVLSWGFIANGTRYRFSSIGKTVFLTREEAEQALKGEHNG